MELLVDREMKINNVYLVRVLLLSLGKWRVRGVEKGINQHREA